MHNVGGEGRDIRSVVRHTKSKTNAWMVLREAHFAPEKVWSSTASTSLPSASYATSLPPFSLPSLTLKKISSSSGAYKKSEWLPEKRLSVTGAFGMKCVGQRVPVMLLPPLSRWNRSRDEASS